MEDESETTLIYGRDYNLEFEVFQDNEGISVNIEISFALDNLNIQDVIFNKKELSKYEDAMTVKQGQRVPQGIYNIQVKAYDDFNNYILFKRDYDFNSKTKTITFSKDQVSHLSIAMENDNLILSGLNLMPQNWKSYNMTHLYNSLKSVYISKMEYESLWSFLNAYDRS